MDRQPHNNLWAEKLLQVSMPDSGEAWADMEVLLDRQLPRRFWSDRRRWLLLILLLLVLIGVCNCPGRGRLFHRSERIARTTDLHQANPSGTPAGANPTTPTPAAATPATPEAPAAPTPATPPAPGPATHATRHARSGPLPPASVTAQKPNRPGRIDSTTRPNRRTLEVTPSGRPAASPTAFGDISRAAREGPRVAKTPTRPRPSAKSTGRRRSGTTRKGGTTIIGGDDTAGSNAGREPMTKKSQTTSGGTITKRSQATTRDTITNRNQTTTGDTITNRNLTTAGDTAAKKSTPVLAKSAPRKDTLRKKPTPPPQDQDQKEKDHGWVFGIGLNQFFPIGGQRGSTYNTDGLTGTLSDYLPVPMIRYYVNHKAYLQVEAQLNTPQATKKNLVFNAVLHDSTAIPGENVQTSATLQQLYYFNIPLSFHYAVTDELNIGTGVQFSHLSNAIGNFDSTLTNLATLEVTNPKATKSFKDDTLYRRIRTNEFRFLMDVNYTWKHIVVGVRYNQALSKFINVPLPTGGSTQSRNSSLQIYLRYILWDTRKKKKQGPP